MLYSVIRGACSSPGGSPPSAQALTGSPRPWKPGAGLITAQAPTGKQTLVTHSPHQLPECWVCVTEPGGLQSPRLTRCGAPELNTVKRSHRACMQQPDHKPLSQTS